MGGPRHHPLASQATATGILDSIIGSSVNPRTRAGDILGRTAAAAGTATFLKVTGSDERLKIVKFELESDDTPTVEMKPDHHQEDDISDDKNNKEEMTTGDHHHHHHEKNQTKLYYGMCMESIGSESISEKMDLMCKIINESSRLISGTMKMCGVNRDNMSSKTRAIFPPNLYTVDSRGRPILSSEKVVGRDGVSNEEMIGYRQDDCGNDMSDNGDDRQAEVDINNGEINEEEMLGAHQDDDDNQTEEMTGNHGKNSKTKKTNNNNKKKKKKNKRKKT